MDNESYVLALIGMKAMTMPASPDKQGRLYVPDDKAIGKGVIREATKMLEPGQTERIQFKAPGKETDFDFVCTFPGHFMTMGGKLIVNRDEAFRVRELFAIYIETRSVRATTEEALNRGWTTKSWTRRTGPKSAACR